MRAVARVSDFGVFLVATLALAAAAAPARAGKYDDLAAFIAHQTASGDKFISDLSNAKSADEAAAALKSSARQQKQNTDELLAILQRHPELRSLPELGLDRKALQLWIEANPDAEKRHASAPLEALAMADAMKRSTSALAVQEKNQKAMKVLSQFHGDPAVTDASNELRATIEENRRRLLNAFL
jgi:hypothetical protein